jgi:hypothetical protein
MKFLLEHQLPKRIRYAKVYLEAGSASVFFSLDGTNADWHATIGKTKDGVEMTDGQYTRLRKSVPAVDVLDDDERTVIIRNASGYDEQWQKPMWVLRRIHRKASEDP